MKKILSAGKVPSWLGAALSSAALLLASGCGDDANDIHIEPLPPDAEFRLISPVGPIEYEGREFFPQCMDGSPYHFFAKR